MDIVERMKRAALPSGCPGVYTLLMNDAAHEINRLRAELLAFERECVAARSYFHADATDMNDRREIMWKARAATDAIAPRMKE